MRSGLRRRRSPTRWRWRSSALRRSRSPARQAGSDGPRSCCSAPSRRRACSSSSTSSGSSEAPGSRSPRLAYAGRDRAGVRPHFALFARRRGGGDDPRPRQLRATAIEGAAAHRLLIGAAATHPFSIPEQQDIAPAPRYREFVSYAGISARRQAVCGLHVHVGMPGPEECMRALEGVLPWLPLVLALSANSPYLAGEETGLASARAEILAQLPRAAAPPAFGSYGDWESFVERFERLGLADGYTRFWWDIRPHPKFGT